MTPQTIKDLQSDLIALGLLANGQNDGIWGPKSQAAWNSAVSLLKKGGQSAPVTDTGAVQYDIAWSGSKNVNDAFVAKVKEIATKLLLPMDDNVGAGWLMSCMAFETGETFSPSIQNGAGAQAYGLIQFMKGAASDMGVTLDQLKVMTALQQLDYVYLYFKRFTGKITSLDDVYLAIFYPAAMGKPDSTVLFYRDLAKTSLAYKQNSGLDLNKDGQITVAEICSIIRSKHAKGLRPEYRKVIKG